MKYIWELKDIEQSWGRYISSNVNHAAMAEYKGLTEVWKIGGDGINACLICMGDGFIRRYKNKEDLIKHLNACDHGFRPLKKGEFIEMIEHNWNKHERIK